MKKFITAFLMAVGLSVSYRVIGESKGPAVVYSAILKNPTLLLFSIVGLYLFLTYKHKITCKTNWLQKLLSLFFAYCTWSITIYQAGFGSINAIISNNIIGILFSVLTLSSYFILLDSAQGIMTYFYMNPEKIKITKNKQITKCIQLFSERSFLISFIIMFSIWFLIASSSFPSVFMGDSLDQVEQVFGYQTRTAAHPVLSTLFVGSFVKLGSLMGSANLGAFIYTTLQLLLISTLIAYSIKLIHDVTKESGKLLFVTLLLALLPSVNGVVILATKDIAFSGFFVLYLITLALYFLNKDYFFEHKLWIAHGFSIIFMMLLRYNTLYFLLLSLVVYFMAEIIGKKKLLRRESLILITLVSIIVASGVNKVLVASFSEKEPKPQWEAMLSVPLQHTARYINYHEEDISPEDKMIINDVLNYDKAKKAYNPVLVDPVRRTVNKDATSEERFAYFQLIGKQVVAHPLMALETLTAMHGSLFNVNQSVNWYYDNTVIHEGEKKGMMERYEKIGLSDNNLFLKFNQVRMFWYFLWDRLPIFSQLNNYGVHIFFFLSLFVLSLRKKRYDLAGLFIPLGAFIGTLIVGPITQGYLRFELPIILFTPLVFVIFYAKSKNEEY